MLRKLTYSKTEGTDIVEYSFNEGLNILRTPEAVEKFNILNEVRNYSVLTTSTQATGDFIEFEMALAERTFFLTIYSSTKVYEFYNDQDQDQKLADFYIPEIIKSGTYETIFVNRAKSYEFAENTEKEADATPQENSLQTENNRLNELNSKIDSDTKLLDNSKNFDIYSDQLSQDQQKLDGINNQLADYDITKRKIVEVEKKRAVFGVFTKLDFELFEKDLKALNSEIDIKNQQIEKLKTTANGNYVSEKKKSPLVLAILLCLDVVLVVGISFVAPIQGVIIGVFLALAICLWYFLSSGTNNLVKKEDKLDRNFEMELDLINKAKTNLFGLIGVASESEYYEKKAELQAYTYEVKQLEKNLSERFRDLNVEALKMERKETEDRIVDVQNNKLTEEIKSAKLNPDEYLKKKRELDIMKMERIRLEGEIKTKSASASKTKESMVLMPETLSEQNQFGIQTLTQNQNTLSADSMETLYVGCLANEIIHDHSKKTIFPILLDDPFAFVTDFNKVKNLLNHFSKGMQLVLLANHKDYDELGYVANFSGETNANIQVNQQNNPLGVTPVSAN
jgi:hypothetical protein